MIKEILEILRKEKEKSKKRYENSLKKYWNMKASDKIHYEYCRKEINKRYTYGFFPVTRIFINAFIGFLVILALLKFLLDLEVTTFITLLRSVSNFIPNLLVFTILIDILIPIPLVISKRNSMKKLNKRYDL